MRQLTRCGWIHNRARMIAASFLTKDLLIDWRIGGRFFMQHLVDGDPALNNGGWQWTASTGPDAPPYFRIFNPVLQGERFDPDGTYVRELVPELRTVPTRHIHRPWSAPVRPADYPPPLVDHAERRVTAIARYAQARVHTPVPRLRLSSGCDARAVSGVATAPSNRPFPRLGAWSRLHPVPRRE